MNNLIICDVIQHHKFLQHEMVAAVTIKLEDLFNFLNMG